MKFMEGFGSMLNSVALGELAAVVLVVVMGAFVGVCLLVWVANLGSR